MFTGLIEQVGRIAAWDRSGDARRLTIEHAVWESGGASVRPGDSVAVNGACLTAERVEATRFTCSVLDETVSRTSLADGAIGERVNLERAMAADARFGGHMVQGHIDALGTALSIRRSGVDRIVRIECPPQLMAGVVEKGSVALDGISLTIATLGPDWLEVHLIPFTWAHTAWCDLSQGSRVNIETDIIGKYVQRYMEQQGTAHLSSDALRRAGRWMD
ncbi:MAG: riboflavin synthase [Lentisphaerae bacterium]|nr:riboflavin synthase [Lentisphaerota bacterium]